MGVQRYRVIGTFWNTAGIALYYLEGFSHFFDDIFGSFWFLLVFEF